MPNKNIETIIIKYFSRSASIDEMIELTEWMREESNYLVFKNFVNTNYLIDSNMLDFDIEGEREKVLQKIKQDKTSLRKSAFKRVFKYAAIFIVTIGLGYAYLINNFSFDKEEQISNTKNDATILPGMDKAILTLENGSEVVLEKGKKVTLKGRTLNEDKLIYDSKSGSKKKQALQFNYLTIPRGGQYFVQLSDNTRVWLNSDSKLKYPVFFIEGQTRMVELIYGEAYFEVSKSTMHDGDRFMVKTGMQEIEVLGTEFNIKAYQDENDIVTTLVEGQVKVGNGIESKFLKPSEQSIINMKGQGITVQKVNKLFDEIAWKEGYFSFRQKTMKDIMKTLSRWYDVEYIFRNPEIENKSFSGVLDRESTIDQILIYIQKTNEINYRIGNNIVIIE
ncbi:FecR family protein [Flavivirga spongiicola]|uniref:FecR family protein n=1 Tax=Flavivirga spongiicola TaxID=421621 RepID=A0ABU7XN32_9FLAO|nr:FecR family protein [Flavivirga sp. MEBiC05379]MDO5981823.1 FecR family protein [Flavivirga sp. MEBiC05379]